MWGRDLSGYDPDGPLPDVDPDVDGATRSPGAGCATTATRSRWPPEWRALAEQQVALSIRELIIEVTARTSFIGTPGQVAEQINRHVQEDAADGYIFVPHLTPHGLDEFVDGGAGAAGAGRVPRRVRRARRCATTSGLERPPSPYHGRAAGRAMTSVAPIPTGDDQRAGGHPLDNVVWQRCAPRNATWPKATVPPCATART